MLYHAYEARRAFATPLFALAEAQAAALRLLPDTPSVRAMRAVPEIVRALEVTHRRPRFAIDSVVVGGEDVAVVERLAASTPFASLVHFAKPQVDSQPKVMIVPGLAGHFGTLVRGTVRTMLADHDVYVAEWHNARDVPGADGRFGLDEYIEHVIEFLGEIGPGTHLMAVCQPCVPVLAAAAIMAEDGHPAQPQGLILMAGPVDARVNPGRVNDFASRTSEALLRRTAIQTVPWPHRGAGRSVYPGFLQVLGFMGMDPLRHASAFTGLLRDVAIGDEDAAARTRAFYEEYFAVLDVAAEFYLDTLKVVFTEHRLARGHMYWRGRAVDPSAITSALLTIEAENDELCPPGQTFAAHALCKGIPQEHKHHHLQPGVGHYGVFSGSRFEREIHPVIREFIAGGDHMSMPPLTPQT
jgi:poly(3-hydroxybutyrate) depolymerase